jgi:hypothetical protein
VQNVQNPKPVMGPLLALLATRRQVIVIDGDEDERATAGRSSSDSIIALDSSSDDEAGGGGGGGASGSRAGEAGARGSASEAGGAIHPRVSSGVVELLSDSEAEPATEARSSGGGGGDEIGLASACAAPAMVAASAGGVGQVQQRHKGDGEEQGQQQQQQQKEQQQQQQQQQQQEEAKEEGQQPGGSAGWLPLKGAPSDVPLAVSAGPKPPVRPASTPPAGAPAAPSSKLLPASGPRTGAAATKPPSGAAAAAAARGAAATAGTGAGPKGRRLAEGGTLVVCPTSLLHQWAREVREKVHPSSGCSLHIYHGKVGPGGGACLIMSVASPLGVWRSVLLCHRCCCCCCSRCLATGCPGFGLGKPAQQPSQPMCYDLTTPPKKPLPLTTTQDKVELPSVLATFTIVATTYGTLASEAPLKHRQAVQAKKQGSAAAPIDLAEEDGGARGPGAGQGRRKGALADGGPLFRTRWHRVVLDEAQSIKNARTLAAHAAWALEVRHRWCLTGTPIQNNVDDLFSYFR